jgi:hypothetical protein
MNIKQIKFEIKNRKEILSMKYESLKEYAESKKLGMLSILHNSKESNLLMEKVCNDMEKAYMDKDKRGYNKLYKVFKEFGLGVRIETNEKGMVCIWKLGRIYRNLGWSIQSEEKLYKDMSRRVSELENELRRAKAENRELREYM